MRKRKFKLRGTIGWGKYEGVTAKSFLKRRGKGTKIYGKGKVGEKSGEFREIVEGIKRKTEKPGKVVGSSGKVNSSVNICVAQRDKYLPHGRINISHRRLNI